MTAPFRFNRVQLLPTDTRDQYRLKLARIAMDEMYPFVAILDAKGTLPGCQPCGPRRCRAEALRRRGQAVLGVLLVGGFDVREGNDHHRLLDDSRSG